MREKPRHEIQRVRQRAHYDEPTVHAVLDASWLAHVAFTGADGQPFVIPMLYVREGRSLLLHGSQERASEVMKPLDPAVDALRPEMDREYVAREFERYLRRRDPGSSR